MKTIIFVHGGESFASEQEYLSWIVSTWVDWNLEPYSEKEEKKKWKIEIAKHAIVHDYRVYMPNFPNPQNAKYSEWKLFFENWISRIEIQWDITLIGGSLWGCFLLKYFSDNPGWLWKCDIDTIHLVAACRECGDFDMPENYDLLQSLWNRVNIWHAEDDLVVPFGEAKEIKKNIPLAVTHFFTSERWYGHFYGMEWFEELEKELF